MTPIKRRSVLQSLSLLSASSAISFNSAQTFAATDSLLKAIPSSGEAIPVIGMGTWQTFNVGSDNELRNQRTEVLKTFFSLGGRLVDSSPMYGSSQNVLGYALEKLSYPKMLFSADKIWTSNGTATGDQYKETLSKWSIPSFDLMQVHNLLSWQEHLEALYEMKKNKHIRYLGITTSHGRRHSEFEKIMRDFPLDFVQLSYNIENRDVEERLLPLALEKGIAVIVNRPFSGGSLIRRLKRNNHPLPNWASEFQCENWAQFLLKYLVSHPSVTCAIPATTKIEHMQENMAAMRGALPDIAMRKRMLRYFNEL